VISRLHKKAILTIIKNGLYYFSPLESGPSGRHINEFLIPPLLFPEGNYYIGYSTMYNYYGFTNQIFQTMHVINTTRQKEKIVGAVQFKMIKVAPQRMYGLEKIQLHGSEVTVSDRERTLVDLIYFPDPVGSLSQAFMILKSQVQENMIDVERFIRYAVLFPAVTLRKRVGIALEQNGIKPDTLEPLQSSVEGTSLATLFDTKSRKGTINKKWGIINNAPS